MLALALTLSVLFSGALSLLCPSQDDPMVTVNVAHPTTCAKYLSCVHTQPREMHCPGGLEWNDHDSLCDYPVRSGCVRNVPEEVARLNGSALVAASVCLPQDANECPLNSSPGEVALRKHRNCRMYYSCSLGKESPMYCPKGLYWNAGSCRCDYENDVECDEGGERAVEEEEEQETVDAGPEEVQQQEEESQPEVDQPEQEEPTQEHEPFEFPKDQPSILLAEPQVEYEPSPRLRFRREAGETTESSNSASSTGSGNSGNTTVAGNSGSSDSPGSSGGSGDSGNSGGSGGSGGNKPIEGGNGDGTVAAGAGIREVSAFAVMLATLVLNAM